MSSSPAQFQETIGGLERELLSTPLRNIKKSSLTARKDGVPSKGPPASAWVKNLSASSPNIHTLQARRYEKYTFSRHPGTKAVNHPLRDRAAASLQTLPTFNMIPPSLHETQHLRSATSPNTPSEATSSSVEETKMYGSRKMRFLSDRLANQGALIAVDRLPNSFGSEGSDPDLEGELTICAKHWSQYTPPESDLPYPAEKLKTRTAISTLDRQSDSVSIISLRSLVRKPSDCSDYLTARGASFSLGCDGVSLERSHDRRFSNSSARYVSNSARPCAGPLNVVEQLTGRDERAALEDSLHMGLASESMNSVRANPKDRSNTCESIASVGHSSHFAQMPLRPFMRIQSSESSATNATLGKALQNEGLRSSASVVESVVPPHRLSFQRGRMIGSGGFGTVYQAILHDGTLAAVKEIKIEPTNLKLIDREVSAMSSLPPHPNCVRYLGSRYSRHHYYIIMEYISGGSISSLRQSIGPFRESVFQRYAYMVLLGLQHLHSHNIIHRDIKGANVLLDERGCAKIVDFGCCKVLNNDKLTLGSGGTPLWMASEVCRGEGATEKSDVWSFGCLCLEMTNETGIPWNFSPGMTLQGLAYALACAQKPPPIPNTLSPISQHFISCCLQLDPKKRWSVSQLLNHEFFNQDYYQQDEDEDELIVSCNTSAQTSAVKRIIQQVNKGQYAGDLRKEANMEFVGPPVQQFSEPTHSPVGNVSPSNLASKFPPASSSRPEAPSMATSSTCVNNFQANNTCYGSRGKQAGSSSNPSPENDQRMLSVNTGFRLEVMEEDDNANLMLCLGTQKNHWTPSVKESTSPKILSKSYYAALDDVIALAHRARTEERRAEKAQSTLPLSLTVSSRSSSCLDETNNSCSDNVQISITSDNSKVTLQPQRVVNANKPDGLEKVDAKRSNNMNPSIATRDPKPIHLGLRPYDTGNRVSLGDTVRNNPVVLTSEKNGEMVQGSNDITISSSLPNVSKVSASYGSYESYIQEDYQVGQSVSAKDNSKLPKSQPEHPIATFVSAPLEPFRAQNFTTANENSSGFFEHQQPHWQPPTRGLAPAPTAPLSKLVWNSGGSGSMPKDTSRVVRATDDSNTHEGKSLPSRSSVACASHSLNDELLASGVSSSKKKQKKFRFKWF